MSEKGKVRIGQKFRRGVKGDKSTTFENFKNIDVTSGSGNKINGIPAKTLSPMTLGPVIDENGLEANFFESYWQGGKMWPSAGHFKEGSDTLPSEIWYKFREKVYKLKRAKRRPLPLKEFGTPTASFYNDKPYGYVESRKDIYVPIYHQLIKDLPVIQEMKKLLDEGTNIMIIDGDGAPKSVYPEGLEMTKENWDKMIDDPKYKFGHGYVVAGLLAGIL